MPRWLFDPLLVLASLLFVAFLLLASRRLEAGGRCSARSLRALLHIAVGLWTFAATILFHRVEWALVPPLLFLALNASRGGTRWFPNIASGSEERRGLWTFPLGVVLLYVTCWSADHRETMLAGVTALALADPAAAAIGRRFGERVLWPGHGRTLEGSIAFFFVTALSSGALAAGLGAVTAWRAAVLCGTAGAVAEAIVPPGWDNAVIPIAVAFAFRAAV